MNMLSFFQYITEALAAADIAKAKANMARIAKQVMAKSGKKVQRKTMDWNSSSNQHGWWHPKNPPHIFKWSLSSSSGNTHLTQLVKNPVKFGIDKSKMNQAILAWMKRKTIPSEPVKTTTDLKTRGAIRDNFQRMVLGKIDICEEMEFLAFDAGWLKVSVSGRWVTVDGKANSIAKSNMKSCVREIMASAPDKEIVLNMSPRPTDSDYKVVILKTEDAKERFLNS
jgi:hypothetical protein